MLHLIEVITRALEVAVVTEQRHVRSHVAFWHERGSVATAILKLETSMGYTFDSRRYDERSCFFETSHEFPHVRYWRKNGRDVLARFRFLRANAPDYDAASGVGEARYGFSEVFSIAS